MFLHNHSCPKQLLSPGFPQPNSLIRSGAGGHQKTRSATVHASCPGRQLARRREPSHESCSNMALCGLPVANLSGGGCSGRSLPVQNEIGEKLFWTRLIFPASAPFLQNRNSNSPEHTSPTHQAISRSVDTTALSKQAWIRPHAGGASS